MTTSVSSSAARAPARATDRSAAAIARLQASRGRLRLALSQPLAPDRPHPALAWVRRHPWRAVLAAAAVGGALALSRPWRWPLVTHWLRPLAADVLRPLVAEQLQPLPGRLAGWLLARLSEPVLQAALADGLLRWLTPAGPTPRPAPEGAVGQGPQPSPSASERQAGPV